MDKVINDLSAAGSDLVAFAASTGTEFASENEKWNRHSAFAEALIEAIGEGKASFGTKRSDNDRYAPALYRRPGERNDGGASAPSDEPFFHPAGLSLGARSLGILGPMMSDEPARSGTGSAEEAANVLAKIATCLTSVQGIVTTFVAICVALGGLVTGSCKLRMFAPAAVCQVLAPVEGETKKTNVASIKNGEMPDATPENKNKPELTYAMRPQAAILLPRQPQEFETTSLSETQGIIVVKLPHKDCVVSILARSRNLTSVPASAKLVYDPNAITKMYALLVGVAGYDNDFTEIKDYTGTPFAAGVNFAARDAEGLARLRTY